MQVAKENNKKAVEIIKNVSLVRDNVNLCLHMKTSMNGVAYTALYVDDNLMIGSPEKIDEVVEQL